MKNNCGFCCTKISDISVKRGTRQILENVSIHIHCGKLTVIIGKNGAGKSTLIKAILGEMPHSGNITFRNKDKKERKIRIGYVPQKLYLENSPITVYDMIASYSSNKPSLLHSRLSMGRHSYHYHSSNW